MFYTGFLFSINFNIFSIALVALIILGFIVVKFIPRLKGQK